MLSFDIETYNRFAGTVIRDDMGLTLDTVGKEVLGSSVKVIIGKDSTLIVTDGSTQHAVEKWVAQIRSLEQVQTLVLVVHPPCN